MFGCSIAFIRMRSPSSAPPDLRRDGSIEMMASRSRSCWSSRKRRTSSSVSELLPAPPVPVTPSVGVFAFAAAASRTSRVFAGTTARLEAGDHPGERARPRVVAADDERGRVRRQVVREVDVAGGDDLADHALQAELLAVLRREDPRNPVVVQFR